MNNEEKIKQQIFPILYFKGNKEISDLIRIFPKYVEVDAENLKLYKSRPGESRYQQTIRNIISHMKEKTICDYDYGYRVSKIAGTKSALFSINRGLIIKEELENFMIDEIERERINERKYTFTKCEYPHLIKKVAEFERQRVSAFVGNQSLRVYDIVNDFPIIAKENPWHILSLNETGDPISIFVEICENSKPKEQKDLLNNLSDNAQNFIKSRYIETKSGKSSKYLFNKSFIYFIDKEEKISILSTQECRKEE